MSEQDPGARPPEPSDVGGSAGLRVLAAFAAALAFALAVYWLLSVVNPSDGLVGFGFLAVLPAALAAFVSYVSDPLARKSIGSYLMVPVWLVLAASVLAVVALPEGIICILMLAPIWLAAGVVGAGITYFLRNRIQAGRHHVSALALMPLLVMAAEPHLPRPAAEVTVSRSIDIAAAPEAVWPLLEGAGAIGPEEGIWTVTQSLIGVPRPQAARLEGQGIGALRRAEWQRGIRFDEVITEWEPLRRIGWAFRFGDHQGWEITDAHLMPDSAYMQIRRGGYSMAPLPGGGVRVSLETTYWMRTSVNGYAALWGELLLGDLEGNVLAILKARAEGVGAEVGS